jgi:hypothetical protein
MQVSELEKLKKIRDDLDQKMRESRGIIGDIDKRIAKLEKLMDIRMGELNNNWDKRIDKEINEYLKDVYDGVQASLNKSHAEIVKTVVEFEHKVSEKELHILSEMEKTFELVHKCMYILSSSDPQKREKALKHITEAVETEALRLGKLRSNLGVLELIVKTDK